MHTYRVDLIGKRFGELEVIDFDSINKWRQTVWKCKCDCGKIVIKRSDSLRRKHCQTCGHSKNLFGSKSKGWKGFGEISGSHWISIVHGAKKRRLQFSMTIGDAWNLFEKQNRKCALSGVELKFATNKKSFDGTASLDRINSSKGYIIDNVQWIHRDINFMKQNFSEDRFLQHCLNIVRHRELV